MITQVIMYVYTRVAMCVASYLGTIQNPLKNHTSTVACRCRDAGVLFLPCQVDDVQQGDGCMTLACREEATNQQHVARCRLVTLASGAAAGRFLQYEHDAPRVAAQTAYGIEADVEGYGTVCSSH